VAERAATEPRPRPDRVGSGRRGIERADPGDAAEAEAEDLGGLRCRECGSRDLRVTHTLKSPGNRIRRRRVCRSCGAVRVTYER